MTTGTNDQHYADLLAEFLPRPPKREVEYDALVEKLDWLMDRPSASEDEHDLFLLLGALVSDYERIHYPREAFVTNIAEINRT